MASTEILGNCHEINTRKLSRNCREVNTGINTSISRIKYIVSCLGLMIIQFRSGNFSWDRLRVSQLLVQQIYLGQL